MTRPRTREYSTTRDEFPRLGVISQLSTIATLIAIVSATIAVQSKLSSIEGRSIQNCRSINAGIVLTLEAGRVVESDPRRVEALDRTIERFERLAAAC